MFELLLERLLLSKLGRYVAGIDKQNLSVALWSGEIIIENALLLPEAFAYLPFPVKLVFGQISRLKISVPWTKLASAPVEIELSGLFVSCTQLQQEEWEFSESSVIAKLRERLEMHELKASSKEETKSLSLEEQTKKKSYTERLVGRIIDNLKVTVRDIHLRFEYIQSPKNVVCGVTLESLNCFTTNSNWEMQFLDRQDKVAESIFKLVELRGLGVYVSCGGDVDLVTTAGNKACEQMKGWIYATDRSLYVLQPLNVQAKVTRKSDSSLNASVTLPEFHLDLHQMQYHSAIRLVEYFTVYGNFLAKEEGKKKYRPFIPDVRTPATMWKFAIDCVIKSIRQRSQPGSSYFQIPKDRLLQYHKVFSSVHMKLKLNRELSPKDLDLYHQVIYICKQSLLYEWTDAVRKKIEEKAKREGERRSVMSYLWGKPAPAKIEAALEAMKSQEDVPTRPSEATFGEFTFLLIAGSLRLRKFMKESETQLEGATFQIQSLSLTYRMKEVSTELEAGLEDMTMESWMPGNSSVFCKKLTSEKLAYMKVAQISYSQGSSKTVKVVVEPVEFIYLKPAVSKLVSFFAIPNVQESVKTAAWDKLQTIQDSYQESLQDMLKSKVVIDLTIGSPRVAIPLGLGEQFGLSLGTIRAYNSPEDYEEDTHENMLIEVSSMEFHFMRSNGKKYPIFPASSLAFKIGSLKPEIKMQKDRFTLSKYDEVPDTTVVASLPALTFQLSSKVYSRILNLGQYIGIEEDAWDATMLDKRSIMKSSHLYDVLKKKGKGLHGWYSTFAIYSGAFLYFFNDPLQTTSSSYFYTKDCRVKEFTDGVPYGICLENRFGSCFLAFDTSEQMQKWRRVLETQISEMETGVQLGKAEENTAKLVCLIVSLPQLELVLTHGNMTPWFQLVIADVHLEQRSRPYDSMLHLTLRSLRIEDLQKTTTFPRFKTLAKSMEDEELLIEITSKTLDKRSVEYRGQTSDLDIAFRNLEVNWNMDLFSMLMNFLQFKGKTQGTGGNSRQVVGSLQSNQVLATIHISINHIELNLNNAKDELTVAQICMEKMHNLLQVKNSGSYFSGTMGNLLIYDMTEWPKTAHRTPVDKIIPYCLFSIRDPVQDIVDFSITILEDDAPEKENDNGTIVKMHLRAVDIVFLNQSYIRISNYFTWKVLGVLDPVGRYKSRSKWPEHYQLSIIDVMEPLEYPRREENYKRFTAITVDIDNPVLYLTPRPNSEEYFQADLGCIHISNTHQQCATRHASELVWTDFYTINFSQMNLIAGSETVAEPFDWTLTIERAILTQSQADHPQDYEQGFLIAARIEKLLFNLSQTKFTLLLNLIDLNMAYDDHMEKVINPDSEKLEYVTDDPKHLGLFMNFKIYIGYWSLLLKCETTEIAELILVGTDIDMMKYLDYYMEMSVKTKVLQIAKPDLSGSSVSDKSQLDQKITDLAFYSGARKAKARRLKIDPIIGRLPIAFLKPIAEEEELEQANPSLTVFMKKGSDGTKDIDINLNQIRLNLSIAILFELQNFFFYGLADYTNAAESPFDFMTKYRPRPEDTHDQPEREWFAPMMNMTVYINQPLILLPAKKGSRVLVLSTDVVFNMWKEREQELVSRVPEEIPAVKKLITCKSLEVYSCKLSQLTNLSGFQHMTKRRIVEPTNIYMEMMQEGVGRQRRGYHQNHEISMMQIYMSYQDVEQFQEAIAYQQEDLKRENPLIEALVVVYARPEAQNVKSMVRQSSLSASSRFSSRVMSKTQSRQNSTLPKEDEDGSSIVQGEEGDNAEAEDEPPPPSAPVKLKEITNTTQILFKGIQAILIHDSPGAYSPVLDLCLKEFAWRSQYETKTSKSCTEISFYVNYYNPVGDCWEPFIERADVIYAAIWNQGECPETQTLVSLSEDYPLNVNVTESMLIYLNKVMATWTEPEPMLQGWRSNSLIHKPNVEVVVPFVIANEIGYPIMVAKEVVEGEKRQDQDVLVINPGEHVPYEVESTGSRIANLETENIQILITKDNQCLATISGINIKRCQLLTKEFKHEGKKYSCLFHVFLVGTVKILSVRSPVMFKNMTAYDVSIRFIETELSRMGECKAGQRCPVPFDMYKDKVQLNPRTMDSSGWPELDLASLLKHKAGKTIELGTSSFVMTLYLDVDRKNKQKISMQLMAPLKIRNALPCPIIVRLSADTTEQVKEVSIDKGQIHSEHSFSTTGSVWATLTLPNFEESEKVLFVKKRTGGIKTLVITDPVGGKVELAFLHKTHGTHTVIIYATTVLLNYTCLPVSFFYSSGGSKERPVAGQTDFMSCVISNSVTELVIDLEGHKSEPFNINTVGTQNVVDIETERNETGGFVNYQFVYDVQLVWPVKEELIYTKLVSVAPRLIMMNFLKHGLFVVQNGSQEQPKLLMPEERAPFYWPDGRFPEFINIRIAERAQDEDGDIDKYRFGWSGAFSVSEIGASTVQCKDSMTEGGFLFIRAEVKLLGLSSIVTFEEESEKYSTYRVENSSQNVSVLLYQDGCKDEARWLNLRSNTAFAWTQPLKEHILIVEFYLGALQSFPMYTGQKYSFMMDKVSDMFKLKIDKMGHQGHLLFCKVCSVGASRVLKIRDSRMEEEDLDDEKVVGDFVATIHHFGLSIIENTAEYCNELFYISLKQITVHGTRTKHSQTYKATLRHLQIDNQYNLMAVFPIVVAPQAEAAKMKTIKFTLTYYLDGNPNVVNFDKCDIEIKPIEVQIENLVLQRLIAMSYRISLELNNKTQASSHEIFQTGSTPHPGSDPAWKSLKISSQDKQYYIGRFRIEPVRLLLSFVPLKDIADIDTEAMDLLLSALGMAITNIDQAPLRFFSLELREIYGSKPQIVNLIWMHYRTQLASELFTVIGHADILGNPIGLLTDVGNGVVDAIYEPVSGLTTGPMGMGKGMVKGAHSLFKNTVSSTFGSLSKISGSLSRGLISITQDDEYIVQRQREKAKYRPKDVVDGIGMGVRSFSLNIGRGITGVFSEPWKGAKKDGFKGFLYGSARGVSGLFAKPVAGTLDVASKVAEGMMSMAHMFEENRTEERMRPPRPVYGEAGTIKVYNQQDAEAWFFTTQIDQGAYLKCKFVKQILSTDLRGELILIVVLLEFILMLDVRKKKVIWSIPIETVEAVEEIAKGLVVRTNTNMWGGKREFLIPFPDGRVIKKIAKSIERVKKISTIYREVESK